MSKNFTLFPDLLSHEELTSLLSANYSKIPNLKRMTREDIVKVYKSMLLPLPQRKYLKTHRGQRLQDRRTERGLVDPSSHALPSHTNVFPSTSTRNSVNERLKPPPTPGGCSTTSTKIRLTSAVTSKAETPSLVINAPRRPSEGKSSSPVKCLKRIDPPSNLNDSEMEATNASKPKRTKITWP